jgi:predicted PurR-regulated permease PerM
LLAWILALLLVGALRMAGVLLLPVAVSVLLAFLFSPIVRALRTKRVPEGIGAGIVVFGMVGLFSVGVSLLAGPAQDWLADAPKSIAKVESRLREMARPLAGLQKTAQHLENATSPTAPGESPKVEVSRPGLLAQLGGSTASVAGATLTIVFLTYFLLASWQLLQKKALRLVRGPTRAARMEEAIAEIETHMSRYLLLNTLIGIAVGLLTWGLLAIVGVPNPLLWAVVAAVLNYIPYLGALATCVLIVVATMVSLDGTQPAVIAGGGFLIIHLLTGQLLTPLILGSKLPLNSVAVFTCLLFWGWVWGIPGAIIAVPLTVMIQVVCAHTRGLQTLAVLLDN